MIKWFSKKNNKLQAIKSINHTGASALLFGGGEGKPRNQKALLAEGYGKNPTIYRCIREITMNAARIPLYLENAAGELIEKHPILDLLQRPNIMQSGNKFIEICFTDYLACGNSYIMASTEKTPKELWRVDPLEMTVTAGVIGVVPKNYIYGYGTSHAKIFPVDGLTGKSQILHRKTVNPLNPWYGLSPLEVAALAGDLLNSGLEWNYSLLRNGGRPSGALTCDGVVSEDAIGKLKQLRNAMMAGEKNAGTIPILTNGLKWTPFSQTAKDMDFQSTLTAADKYIAMVYGVPLPLVGTESSTYNNVALAQEKLYEDTVIPLFQDYLNDLNMWLSPMFGDELKICMDLDSIPALEAKRQKLFDRLKAAVDSGILTRDEAREAMGYEPKGGVADTLLVSSSLKPIDIQDDPAQQEQQPLEDDAKQAKALYKSLIQAGWEQEEAEELLARDLNIPLELISNAKAN